MVYAKLPPAMSVMTCLGFSLQAACHMFKEEPGQSYRLSYFTLIAMNFGSFGAMVKGEMPWDDAMLQTFAKELGALASMDMSRTFGPGTDKGTTRAKPGTSEFRARGVRLFREQRPDYASDNAAYNAIAPRLGCAPDT